MHPDVKEFNDKYQKYFRQLLSSHYNPKFKTEKSIKEFMYLKEIYKKLSSENSHISENFKNELLYGDEITRYLLFAGKTKYNHLLHYDENKSYNDIVKNCVLKSELLKVISEHYMETENLTEIIKYTPIDQDTLDIIISLNPSVLDKLNLYFELNAKYCDDGCVCGHNIKLLKKYSENLSHFPLKYAPLEDEDIEKYSDDEKAVSQMYNNNTITASHTSELLNSSIDLSTIDKIPYTLSLKLISSCLEEASLLKDRKTIKANKNEFYDLDNRIRTIIKKTDQKTSIFADEVFSMMDEYCSKTFSDYDEHFSLSPFNASFYVLTEPDVEISKQMLDDIVTHSITADKLTKNQSIYMVEGMCNVIKHIAKRSDINELEYNFYANEMMLRYNLLLNEGEGIEDSEKFCSAFIYSDRKCKINDKILTNLFKDGEKTTAWLLCSNLNIEMNDSNKTLICNSLHISPSMLNDFLTFKEYIKKETRSLDDKIAIQTVLLNNLLSKQKNLYTKVKPLLCDKVFYLPVNYPFNNKEEKIISSAIDNFDKKHKNAVSYKTLDFVKEIGEDIKTTRDTIQTIESVNLFHIENIKKYHDDNFVISGPNEFLNPFCPMYETLDLNVRKMNIGNINSENVEEIKNLVNIMSINVIDSIIDTAKNVFYDVFSEKGYFASKAQGIKWVFDNIDKFIPFLEEANRQRINTQEKQKYMEEFVSISR